MSSDSPQIAPDLIQRIRRGSKKIGNLADEVSKRITNFEDWLNMLRGRVETTAHVTSNDFPIVDYFALRFHRSGKRWILSSCHCQEGTEPWELNWKPLLEAPLETKIEGLRALPQLLNRMEDAQAEMAQSLTQATAEFDAFIEQIGVADKLRDLENIRRWNSLVDHLDRNGEPQAAGFLRGARLIGIDNAQARVDLPPAGLKLFASEKGALLLKRCSEIIDTQIIIEPTPTTQPKAGKEGA
jgi:hypothetical protein